MALDKPNPAGFPWRSPIYLPGGRPLTHQDGLFSDGASCTGTVTGIGIDVYGTLVLGEDGAYFRSGVTDYDLTTEFSMACLSDAGLECSLLVGDDCTVEGESCLCRERWEDISWAVSGSYSVGGCMLNLYPAFSHDLVRWRYCRRDDVLRVIYTNDPTDSPPMILRLR